MENVAVRVDDQGRAGWTGVSAPGHLGSPDKETVRRSVRDAMECFGKSGFILGVSNSMRNYWPWSNTQALFDEWRRLR